MPTTTFNGQAATVTLIAIRAVNQATRYGGSKHCHCNQRTGACR